MTTIEHATRFMHARSPQAFSARVAHGIRKTWRAYLNRRAFYRLGEMSDLQLADIGLTRSDLSVAIDLPFGSDPTARLNAMARERIEQTKTLARRIH